MEDEQAACDDLEGSEKETDVFDQEEDGLDLHNDGEKLDLALEVLGDLLLTRERFVLVIGAVVVGVRTTILIT